MKNIFITTLIGLLSFAFCSCSDDNPADIRVSGEKAELRIKSAAYSDMYDNEICTPREFTWGDTIGLYLPKHYENRYLFAALQYYNWWQTEIPVVLSSEPDLLMAFYPYRVKDHAYQNATEVNVEHISQTDYMYGYATDKYVFRENPHVELIMYHALALVQFKFIKNDYPYDCNVQKVSIKNVTGKKHLRSRGKLDLELGEVSALEGYYDEAAITPKDMNFSKPYTCEQEYARILVLPIERIINYGDLYFEFVIDGHTYSWPVKEGTYWESGKKYTYEVEMVPGTRTLKSSPGIHVELTQITERK